MGESGRRCPEGVASMARVSVITCVFNGADVVYDFSDQALAEALATFLNPKLAAVVRGR